MTPFVSLFVSVIAAAAFACGGTSADGSAGAAGGGGAAGSGANPSQGGAGSSGAGTSQGGGGADGGRSSSAGMPSGGGGSSGGPHGGSDGACPPTTKGATKQCEGELPVDDTIVCAVGPVCVYACDTQCAPALAFCADTGRPWRVHNDCTACTPSLDEWSGRVELLFAKITGDCVIGDITYDVDSGAFGTFACEPTAREVSDCSVVENLRCESPDGLVTLELALDLERGERFWSGTGEILGQSMEGTCSASYYVVAKR